MQHNTDWNVGVFVVTSQQSSGQGQRKVPRYSHVILLLSMEPEAGVTTCTLSEEKRRFSTNHVAYLVVRAEVGFSFWP